MLTDTHLHLYSEEFSPDRALLIERAFAVGVNRFLLPNIDVESLPGMYELVESYPMNCFPMMGLHPCYVKENYEEQLLVIRKNLEERRDKIIAIGEIGIDLYWDVTFRKEQEEAFRRQVKWAAEFDLPIAIHTRNATDETIALLDEMQSLSVKGVFHCFSGNIEQARKIVSMGFYLGIGGVVTFKNSGLNKVVEEIALEHLLLETDGPYLAPVPYRGKRNEPAYLYKVAEKLAQIKNISVEEVASVTTAGAQTLFKLPPI